MHPVLAQPATAAPLSEAADIVFTNGKVNTVDVSNSWVEAIAVRGNKIVYAGDNAGAAAFVGDATESIDLGGKLMLPCFVEGHFHTTMQGIIMHGPDLQTDSMDELVAKLKEYAEANPGPEFINGWGVRVNTYSAAYGIGVEDKIGSIEKGKLADLIVLDKNLFDIDPHDIYKANVMLTILDGKVRYRDGL